MDDYDAPFGILGACQAFGGVALITMAFYTRGKSLGKQDLETQTEVGKEPQTIAEHETKPNENGKIFIVDKVASA